MPRARKADGWGLVRGNTWRTYGVTDCLGIVAQQACIWPTKRLAQQMAVKGETPRKIRLMWFELEESDASKR